MSNSYTKFELARAVHLEKQSLIQERLKLTRRLGEIEYRLSELDKAEALLEGME